MKVLDLQCRQQHSFEGWFGSEDDFQSQLTRGLVQCPLCGNTEIIKKLSAPRLNLGKSAAPSAEMSPESKTGANAPLSTSQSTSSTQIEDQTATSDQTRHVAKHVESSDVSSEAAEVMQAAWLEVTKHVMANTEDVGSSFASEARKIHYGEADERAIRGQATLEQTKELIEEGIDVLPMSIPESLKRTLN